MAEIVFENKVKKAIRLLVVTGDYSGDQHAASVVRHMKAQQQNVEVRAVGGLALKAEGVGIIEDHSKLNVMGVAAVLSVLHHMALGRKILDEIEVFRPGVVLLVDYGGFNLWLAGKIKKRFPKQPVHYFITPQLWASRPGRMKKIQNSVDHVYCIFPFEEDLYQKSNVSVTYVGHPLAGTLPPPENRETFCARHQLDATKMVVAIFPGSRRMEIDYLLATIVESAQRLVMALPDQSLQFVIAKADSLDKAFFDAQLEQVLADVRLKSPETVIDLTVIGQENHGLQSVADVAIVKSGTSTLEAALYKTPMVIVYKAHWLSGLFAKKVCLLPCFGLPNILLDMTRPIVPELFQEDATPEKICRALLPFFDKTSQPYEYAREGFDKIARMLGEKNATQTVALSLLKFKL